MGTYLNRGNKGFEIIKADEYVDKTGLISLVNDSIDTTRMLTCVSRPRRFGKSFAAKMLCAYYDKSCDSHELFDDLEIAGSEDYEKYLNKYDVIYLDMSNLVGKIRPEELISFIEKNITKEVLETYPDVEEGSSFDSTLINVVEHTGNKFIMIIDEWDAPIRETPQIEKEYLWFLRMLFKGSGTTDRIFAGVYMTGILPIKKDGSQSALSDFWEYTMIDPLMFDKYIGFTEAEVKALCDKYGTEFDELQKWYDGYVFDKGLHIYNPNSVIKAVTTGKLKSYWTQSSAADSLVHFIGMDFDGLSKTVAELMGGASVRVNVNMFDNDLVSFRNKDSVLTLLIHLGYLTYDEDTETARIPNEEIHIEFSDNIREVKRDETIKRVAESHKLIMDTVNMNADAVATQIERIHEDETAKLFYNNEQALRGIIKLAYFAYKDYYLNFEELPAGAGYADIVYFPKKDTTLPALLIELKWDKSAEGAIDQIKNKHYPNAIREFGGDVLLVGISYDKDAETGTRTHHCVIERMV